MGAFYALSRRYEEQAAIYLKVGVMAGLLFSLLQIFPTGDGHGKMVARHQPAALAAMEGKFHTGTRAEMAIIGQPDVNKHELENPVIVPGVLSYLAYGSFGAEVKGLDAYPHEQWPDNIELLYYCYHIMVGLGTLFIVIMGGAAVLQWRGLLVHFKPALWVLMLAWPFPYIATSAGWMTTELGRQPWLIYGLLRTSHGTSPLVSGGDVAFSVLGFMGMYLVLSMVFVYSVFREIAQGPRQKEGEKRRREEEGTQSTIRNSQTSIGGVP